MLLLPPTFLPPHTNTHLQRRTVFWLALLRPQLARQVLLSRLAAGLDSHKALLASLVSNCHFSCRCQCHRFAARLAPGAWCLLPSTTDALHPWLF